MLSADVLAKENGFPYTKPLLHETSFRSICALSCPSCSYCEFPGCDDHQVLLTVQRQNGHAYCHANKDGACSTSTAESSPWNLSCRECGEVRCDVTMWTMSDLSIFRFASAIRAMDKATGGVMGRNTAICLTCDSCGAVEAAFSHKDPLFLLTVEEHTFARSQGTVFSVDHLAPNCSGSIISSKIVVSASEVNRLTSILQTTPRLLIPTKLKLLSPPSPGPLSESWVTHPSVDGDQTLLSGSLRSATPSASFSLAKMDPPQPYPVWQTRAFVGLFCDPFVRDTELEGGSLADALAFQRHYLRQLARTSSSSNNDHLCNILSKADTVGVEKVADLLSTAYEISTALTCIADLPHHDPPGLVLLNGSPKRLSHCEMTERKKRAQHVASERLKARIAAAAAAAAATSGPHGCFGSDSEGSSTDDTDTDEASYVLSPSDLCTVDVAGLCRAAASLLTKTEKEEVKFGSCADESEADSDEYGRQLFHSRREAEISIPSIKEQALAAVVMQHIRRIEAMANGDVYSFPGGYFSASRGHALMVTLLKNEADFSLVVTNTGEGISYHPEQQTQFKPLTVTNMCLEGVAASRAVSPFIWTLFFRLQVFASNQHHILQLYDVIFPFLVGGPLKSSLVCNPEWLNSLYLTAQRAGTCFYRCVSHLTRYLLLLVCGKRVSNKMVSFGIRYLALHDTLSDLQSLTSLYDASDIPLIRIAARQTIRAFVRSKMVDQSGMMLSEGLRRTVLSIEQRLSSLPVPESLQWAPTYLTGIAAELSFTNKVALCASPGAGTSEMGHSEDGRSVISFDISSASLASGHDLKNQAECSISLPAIDSGDEEGAGAHPVRYTAPLLPSSLLRQSSCDMPTDPNLEEKSTSADCEGDGPTEEDIEEILLPPPSICSLPDKAQMLSYLPPALRAEPNVSGLWSFFGGFDSFAHNLQSESDQMAGPSVAADPHIEPDLSSLFPACDPRLTDETNGSSDIVLSLTVQRDAVLRTMEDVCKAVSSLLLLGTAAHYHHAHALLLSLVENYIPVPKTLRERGLDVFPPHRYSDSKQECTESVSRDERSPRRNICCIWQDSLFMPKDVSRAVSLFKRVQMQLLTTAASLNHDAPSEECRNIMSMAHILASIDALMRVRTTNSPWATALEGGLPLEASLSDVQLHAIFAVSTKDALGVPLEVLTSCMPIYSPANAVVRGKVLAYLKEREARANALIFTVKKVGVFSAVLKKDGPESRLLQAFSQCTGIPLERTTKPGGDHIHDPFKEALGWWLTSSVNSDASSRSQSLPPFSDNHPELYALRDATFALQFLLLPSSSRTSAVSQKLWPEKDAEPQWDYFVPDAIGNSNVGMLLRWFSKVRVTTLTFENPRSICSSPACADYYIFPNSLLDDGKTGEGMRELQSRASLPSYGTDVVFERYLAQADLGPAHVRSPAAAGGYFVQRRASNHFDEVPLSSVAAQLFGHVNRDAAMSSFSLNGRLAVKAEQMTAPRRGPADTFQTTPGVAEKKTRNDTLILAADVDSCLSADFSELAVQYGNEFPTFQRFLTPDESERLIVALSEPYNRIPLLLTQFVEGAKNNWLQNTALRQMLIAATFEPHRWQSSFLAAQPFTSIPAHPFVLGTPHGLLFNELLHSPGSVLAPVCALFDAVFEPLASQTSSVIDSLGLDESVDSVIASLAEDATRSALPSSHILAQALFTTRYLIRVESFARLVFHGLSNVSSASCSPFDEFSSPNSFSSCCSLEALAEGLKGIRSRLVRVALPLLLCWRSNILGQEQSAVSERDRNFLRSSGLNRLASLHAHIALILGPQPSSGTFEQSSLPCHPLFSITRLTPLQTALFLGCVGFVQMWAPSSSPCQQSVTSITPNQSGTCSTDPESESRYVIPLQELMGLMASSRSLAFKIFDELPVDVRSRLLSLVLCWIRGDAQSGAATSGLLWERSLVSKGCYTECLTGTSLSVFTALTTTNSMRITPAPAELMKHDSFVTVIGASDSPLVTTTSTREYQTGFTVFGTNTSAKLWSSFSRAQTFLMAPSALGKGDTLRVAVESGGIEFRGVQYTRKFGQTPLADAEEWVAKLFVPFLVESYGNTELLPFSWFLPSATIGDSSVAVLFGYDSFNLTWQFALLGRSRATVQLFFLQEQGRVLYPVLSFSSISSLSLSSFAPSLLFPFSKDHDMNTQLGRAYQKWKKRFFSETNRFAAGNRKPRVSNGSSVVLTMKAPAPPLGFERSLAWAPQGDVVHVPPFLLNGLVPSILLSIFTFELSLVDFTLRGLPLPDYATQPEWRFEIIIVLSDVPEGLQDVSPERALDLPFALGNKIAVIFRVPHRDDLVYEQRAEIASHTKVLISLSGSLPGSPLGRLTDVITRIENVSETLVWANVPAQVKMASWLLESEDGFTCPQRCAMMREFASSTLTIDTIELPRLNLFFKFQADSAGRTRLFSKHHPDMYVSDVRSYLIAPLFMGIPHGLLLQNKYGSLFMLVPNYPVSRPPVRVSPLSADITQDRFDSKWVAAAALSPYYLYPIHSSHLRLLLPEGSGLGPLFYLVTLRLLHRAYADAFQLAGQSFTDTKLTSEEIFMFKGIEASLDDKHPDAVAVRIRLQVLTAHCDIETHWVKPVADLFNSGEDYSIEEDIEELYAKRALASRACSFSASDAKSIDELISKKFPKGVVLMRTFNMQRILRAEHKINVYRENELRKGGCLDEHVSDAFGGLVHSSAYQRYFDFQYEKSSGGIITRRPRLFSETERFESIICDDYTSDTLSNMEDELCPLRTTMGTTLLCPKPDGVMDAWDTVVSVANARLSFCQLSINSPVGWKAMVTYDRPPRRKLRGAYLISTVIRALEDHISGSRNKLGLLLVFDLLQGGRPTTFCETSDQRKARKDRAGSRLAHRKQPASGCLQGTSDYAVDSNGRGLESDILPGTDTAVPRIITESIRRTICKARYGIPLDARETRSIDAWCVQKAKLSKSDVVSRETIDLCSLLCSWHAVVMTRIRPDSAENMSLSVFSILGLALEQKKKAAGYSLNSANATLRSIQHPWAQKAVEPSADAILSAHIDWRLMRSQLLRSVRTDSPNTALHSFIAHCGGAALKLIKSVPQANVRNDEAGHYNVETTIFDYDPAPAAIDRSLQNRFISVEMLPSHLRMSPHELEALITQPLFSANIPIVLKAQNSRSDCSVSCEPQSLPFNLDSHPAFSGKHAADMLARIKHDYSSFRSTSQSEHIPIIPQIESFLSSLRQESATHSELDATLKHLSILTMSLKTLLERDIMFASKARVFAEWSANSIPMANVSLPEDLEESVTLKNTFDQVPSLLRSVSVSATGVSAQSLVQKSSLPMRESKQIAVRPPVGKNKTLKTTNTMFLRERCLHDILLMVQSDPWRSSSIADLAKEWSNELSVTTFPITASHYGKLIMRSLDSVRSFITNLPADHFLREDLGETCPSPAASSCSLEAITLAFERPPALQNASGEIKRILKTIPLTEKGREMEIDKCPRTSADFLSLSMLANANGAPTDENKTEKVSKEKVNEMEIKESVEGFFATAAFIERGKMRLKEVLHRGEHATALPLCKALRRAKEKQRKTALRLRLLLAASFLRVEQSKKLNRNRILRACSASTQLVSRLLVYELIRVGAHDTMRLARQNMLEQYAEQKNVFRMNDLVHAIASTTSDGSNTLLHCLARHVSDNEGTQRVMTVTALFMLLTNRISLARKALHATRTFAQNIVRCCLRRSSPIFLQPNASSSDISSLQQQSNSLIQLLKTGLYYVTIVRTAQDGDETVGSDCLYARALQATDTVIVDPRMLAFEFAMGITLRKEQVSQVRSFLTLKERPFPRDMQNPTIDSLSPLGHSTLSLEQCGRHDALKPSDAAPNGYKIPLACVTELPRLSRAPQSSSDVQHGSTASPSRLHSHHLSLALNLHELRKAELQACAPAKTYRVQQMLMGAGKTTVVAPLILSISSSLPKQSVLSRASPVEKPFSVCVVPQALLQMTINVLRSRLTGNYAIPICSFHMQRDFGGFLGLGSSMISQQGRLAQRAEAWMDAHSVGFTYDSRRIIEAMEQDEFDLLGAQSQPPDFISPSQDISALPITHAPPLEPLLAKMLFVQSLGGILVCSDTTLKTLLLKRLEIVAAVEDIIEKIVTFAFPQLTEAEIASRIESVRSGIAANLSSTFSKLMRRRFPFQVHKLLSYRVALNYLSRIVDCIRSGTLVMDEVDVLLHPLKSELNFPIGSSSHLQPAPSRWRIPLTLLDTIHAAADDASSLVAQSDQCVFQGRSSLVKKLVATTEGWTIFNELRKTVSIGIDSMAILLDPHPILLDQVFYNEQLKPLLSLWARLILVSLDVPVTAINLASQSVEPQLASLHDVVLDYIRARDVSKTCEPGRSVSLLLKPEQLGLTNLIRDWVHSYLPHVLCKVNRVSFGLLPPLLLTQSAKNHPRSLTAVPYAGKDVPSSSAEFAHPDILAGLTVISYMAQGLRPSDVRLALMQLKKLASKELGPESQRPSAVLFECWMRSDLKRESCQLGASHRGEGKALGSLFTVQPGDASQLQLIHNRVRHVPGLIEFYLLHHVFPTAMKRQALHLSLSGGDVASAPFFGSVVGFSGTPSNLLPKSLGACSFERGSDGRIVSTLTNLATTSTKLLSCGWTAKVLLKDVATSSGEQAFMSLIDTGALVTGLTNEEVANFLLDCGLSHVGGVVFFDSADVPYVMLRQCDRNGKRVIIPFSLCGLPNDQRFTFYDQVHTVGIDISQAPDARAAITLGKDLTLRDFSQGAYRMRGISFGQKITIITPPELCSHVRSATSMPPDSALTPSSIVAWLLVNSALSEQVQFVQLCRMHAVERVRSTLIDIIGLGYWGKAAERPTMLNDGVWRNVPDLLSLFCERNNLNLVKKVPSTELLEDVIRKQKKLIPWRSLRSCHASFSKEDTSFESAALALAAAGGGMDRYGRLEQEMVTEQIVETEVQSDISRKTATRCSVPESPPPWSIAHLFSIPSPIAKAQVDAFELLQGSSSHSQQGKCRLQNPFMSKQFLQASPEFQDHIKSMYAAFKTHIDGGNDPNQLLSLFSEDRKREVELLKKRLDYDAQKAVKDVNNWSMCQSARTRSALAETQRENVSLHGVQNSFAHPFFSLRKTAVAQDTDGHELPIPETVAFSRHLLPPTLKKLSKTDGIPFIPSVIVVAEWHVITREAPSVKTAEEPRCRSSKDAISNVCDFVSRANGGVVPVAFIVTSLKAAGLHLEAEQIRLAVGNTESMSAHEMKNLLHQTMAVVSSETAKTSSELEASSIKCSSWLVALCLAEAASLRRAIHSGSLDAAAAAWAEETHSSTGQSVIGVSLKLHHLNNDGPPIAFWASWNSKADCSHQASVMQSATSSWLQSSVGKAARIMHLLFNSFFFFTKDDVSTLVRALSHVPLSSRRALFQLFLESRMRSHSSPEGTPVDRVFKMSNPARLLQVSSVANLLADIIVKSTDGLKGFFSSFGLTDKDHISPRHLREALIRSSAFSAPIASFADERCVAGPTLGLRCEERVIFSVVRQSLSLVSAPQRMFAATFGCLLRSALTEGEKTEESPGVSAYFDALDEAGSGWLIRPSARAKMADIQAHKLLCSDVIKLERLEVAVQSLMLEWDSDEDGLISYSELESWLRQLGKC